MYKSLSIAVVAGGLMMAGPWPAVAARNVSETRPLSPEGHVRVETIAGTLIVRGWDRGEVSVTGTLADELKLDVDGTDGNVSVRVEWPERRHGKMEIRDDECRLEVKVPAGVSLEAESVSASVDVSGVNGEVDVQTVSGGVQVSGNPKEVDVEAVSGEIRLDVGTRQVRVEAVSGDIHARTGGGGFEASVVSGEIVLQGESFESVDLESVSGGLEFTGALERKGEMEVSNHSGDVDIALRGELSAKINVTTFSGSIRSELGGEIERTSQYTPGEEYERTVGDGTGRISIDAFSGTVRIRRL